MPTTVTSVRLDERLLRQAIALGLNISKVTEGALKAAVRDLQPRAVGIVPGDAPGIGSSIRVLMMDDGKFKPITKIRVGEAVVSYNESTRRCEQAHVIDVGPLTDEEAISVCYRISDNIGTRVDVLPATSVFCRVRFGDDAKWTPAEEVRPGHLIMNVSGSCRRFGPSGTTSIGRVQKENVKETFFKLEVYPNNSFFGNSNSVRKLHLVEDMLPAAWGMPLKGYPGQIGRLLET
jgi:hypothetical protein